MYPHHLLNKGTIELISQPMPLDNNPTANAYKLYFRNQ